MPDKSDHSKSKDQRGASSSKSDTERKGKQMSQDHGGKGGQQSGGNFKNDPERAAEAGRKGGQR